MSRHAGVPFFRRSQAGASLEAALRQIGESSAEAALVVASANGTFIDEAESQAVDSVFGPLPAVFPKRSLGDALGASALAQVICATQAAPEAGTVLVPAAGLNHQAAAAVVSAPARGDSPRARGRRGLIPAASKNRPPSGNRGWPFLRSPGKSEPR